MTTTVLWFVLAGFLLGFTASTLWEWFHFRKERIKTRDQRVRELEAKVRELEQGTATVSGQPSVLAASQMDVGSPAPRYRSPGVFLETEKASAGLPNPPAAPAEPLAAAPPETGSLPERRVAGQIVTPERTANRSEPTGMRRRSEAAPLAVRRETLRSGMRSQSHAPLDESEGAGPQPSWRDDPALTRRSADHPDNLSKVKGIGEVYRQRLYKAGISTWHQVATTDVARLRQVTHAYPSSNVEEWPPQAQLLAEKHSRVNAVYTGPAPDELTKIVGIGPVSAQTLYRAGICTYEQLAVTPVEELAALFPVAVAGDQPDFPHWIAQASALADAKHRR